jgi:hypothetical protein
MSEFKRIPDRKILQAMMGFNEEQMKGFSDNAIKQDMDTLEARRCRRSADAQLASCKKEQEQERRAIGEWLGSLATENWNDLPKIQKKYSEGKEALKRGTLPEGIKEDG